MIYESNVLSLGMEKREIEFRGLKLDSSKVEWVYGDFYTKDVSMGSLALISDSFFNKVNNVSWNGISQYLGFKDSNNKRVYEGDLLRVTFGDGIIEDLVISISETSDLLLGGKYYREFNIYSFTVIGNIYEEHHKKYLKEIHNEKN